MATTLTTASILEELTTIGRGLAFWSNRVNHGLEDHWKADACRAALQKCRKAYAAIRDGADAIRTIRELRFATADVWQARRLPLVELAATEGFRESDGWAVVQDRIVSR